MKDAAQHDWKEVSLGEICEKTETVDPRKTPLDEFEYVDVSSVSNETFTIGETQKLLGADAPSRARRRIRSGDILFATIRPTLKRIAQVPERLDGQVCSTGYIVLRAKPELDPRFLMHALFRPDFMDAMETLQSGASYPAVTDKQVRDQKIPLPPLEEQQRIVAVLDDAFEGLARARAHAETNHKNSQELFESELNTALEDLSHQHGVRSLGSVSDFRNGFAFKSARFKPNGEPVVRISNIQDGEIDEAKMVFTDPDDYSEDLTRYAVQPNDLLIAMSGATTGKVGFNTTGKVLLQNQRVGRFCPTEKLDLRFLYYFLSTKVAEHLSISAGAAQPNLSTKQINEIEMPVPPLDVQEDFLGRIEILKGSVGALKDNYDNCLKDLDDLRQSLLQKAFAGELI